MIRTWLLAAFTLTAGIKADAQYVQFYYDPGHFQAVTENQAMRMGMESYLTGQTGKVNDNLKNINLNVVKVLVTRELIYNSLVNVNEALKDGKEMIYIGKLLAEIGDESRLLLRMASENPQFAPFATKQARGIVMQAANIHDDINRYVLSGSKDLLMDHGTRDELLRTLSDRLKLLRAEIYGTRQAIYWAKMDGFWHRLNPFREWINQDRAIIEDIIWKAKYLGT